VLLRLEQISRAIAGRTLFERVEFEVRAGDRIGIVGPNGAGKTTLLRIAAGIDPPDGGRVHIPRGACLGLLRQEIDPRRDATVRSEAATALSHLDDLEAELRSLEHQIAEAASGVPDALACSNRVVATS
jgi:ATP-binding cassette subfamily F protein 3